MLLKKGFKKIFYFGLHEITLQKRRYYKKKIEDRVRYNTYDSVNIRKKDFNQEMALALEFINDDFLELKLI
jgi:formiminoglutamase